MATQPNKGANPATPRKRSAATRSNSKTTAAAIERYERDLQCVEYRRAGMTWEAIARALGYSSPGYAHRRFMHIMETIPRESIEEARELELDRLDKLQRAIWTQCLDTSNTNQHWAMDRVLKISELRQRLLGLPRPVAQTITVLTDDTVSAAIKQLEAEMDARIAELPAELLEGLDA